QSEVLHRLENRELAPLAMRERLTVGLRRNPQYTLAVAASQELFVSVRVGIRRLPRCPCLNAPAERAEIHGHLRVEPTARIAREERALSVKKPARMSQRVDDDLNERCIPGGPH